MATTLVVIFVLQGFTKIPEGGPTYLGIYRYRLFFGFF